MILVVRIGTVISTHMVIVFAYCGGIALAAEEAAGASGGRPGRAGSSVSVRLAVQSAESAASPNTLWQMTCACACGMSASSSEMSHGVPGAQLKQPPIAGDFSPRTVTFLKTIECADIHEVYLPPGTSVEAFGITQP